MLSFIKIFFIFLIKILYPQIQCSFTKQTCTTTKKTNGLEGKRVMKINVSEGHKRCYGEFDTRFLGKDVAKNSTQRNRKIENSTRF